MANRCELLNNLQRAMQPMAHWYDITDTHVMLEIQSEVIYEGLHNRQCNIKWSPMHEQVTMLRKLLSHIFEHYTEVQDDGYISDEDIDKYPETFMPRPRILLTRFQESAPLQQLDSSCKLPCQGTKQDLSRISIVSGEYCSHWKLNQKTNQCH